MSRDQPGRDRTNDVNPGPRGAPMEGTPVIMTDPVYTITNGHAADAPRKGISSEALSDVTKQITVEFAGMTADVWYKPWVLTPRAMRRIQSEAKEAADGDGFVARMVCEWVSEWELTVGGQPCPITPMALEANFPGRLIQTIFNDIIEDMKPTPTTGDASSAGSSTDATA